MRIRVFDEADTEPVVALWREAGLTRPWNDPRLDVQRKRSVQPELFFVAEDADALVGTVMAGYDGHRGWIYYLAVAVSHRGTGVGRTLLDHAETVLRALGCPKVQLQVRVENSGVVDFYRRLGYEPYESLSLGKRLIVDGPADEALTLSDADSAARASAAGSDAPGPAAR